MNFLEVQKNALNLSPQKVSDDLFVKVKQLEDYFFDLNIQQLEQSEGADNTALINRNNKYSGFYTEATEAISKESPFPKAKKIAGQPYNFLWEGDFIEGFTMKVINESVEIFSTGTGSGTKKSFFDGYKNLFGLNDQKLRIAIDEKIRPFIIEYYRKALT